MYVIVQSAFGLDKRVATVNRQKVLSKVGTERMQKVDGNGEK